MINKIEFILMHIPESTKFSIDWKYELYQIFSGKEFAYGEKTVIYKKIADKHKFIEWRTVEQYAKTDKFKELLNKNTKL